MPLPIVSVRDVLPTLGFTQDWAATTDQPPGFVFKRDILELHAAQCTGFHLRPQILFSGMAVTDRTLQGFEFALPLAVESKEQAVAMIAYYIGSDFVPSAPIDWLDQGRLWKHLLPWEKHWRELRQRDDEYEQQRRARPHCLVARDWMRMLRKQLRVAVNSAGEHDEFFVEFDGHMLKITLLDTAIGAPARGPASWNCYRGRIASLAGLPTRFLTDPVEIGIWNGRLEIEQTHFAVTPAAQLSGATVEFPVTVPVGVKLYDVEGIPVSFGNIDGVPAACVAWDTSPPRRFDPSSASRNGALVDAATFRRLIASVAAERSTARVGDTAVVTNFPATVPVGVKLFDVEGIPVSLGKVLPSVPYCAAWDRSPPRKFDPDSARRNGAPVDAVKFERLIAKAQAGS